MWDDFLILLKNYRIRRLSEQIHKLTRERAKLQRRAIKKINKRERLEGVERLTDAPKTAQQ